MENCIACHKPVGSTCRVIIQVSMASDYKLVVVDSRPDFLCEDCYVTTTESDFILGKYRLTTGR